jgi:hypothetical protein
MNVVFGLRFKALERPLLGQYSPITGDAQHPERTPAESTLPYSISLSI